MKKNVFILSLFISVGLCAQIQTPVWDTALSGTVKWVQVNDWGIVIVACDNGLFGVDPRDGNILWGNESLTNIKEDNYRPIDDTPLVLIDDKGNDAKSMVLNGLSGEVIFDSSVYGFEKVVSSKILPELEGLLVAFKNSTGDGIAFFNYVNGTHHWTQRVEKSKSNNIQPEPFLDKNGHIVFANGSTVYHFIASSGDIDWKVEFKKNVIDLFTDPEGMRLYVVTGSPSDFFRNSGTETAVAFSGGIAKFQIEVIQIQNGEALFKKPIEYSKSKYSGVALGQEDFFLLHTLSANQYDYSSEIPKWKKEKLGTGGDVLSGIYDSESGLIYFAADGAGRTYGYYVNNDGEQLWKKKLIINGDILLLEELKDAFFYISTKGVNFISKEDGKEVWQGNKYLSSNYAIDFIQSTENEYVIYIGGKLIRVDLEQKDWTVMADNFGFWNEVPSRLQKIEEGYVISGNQNVALFDQDGREVYHVFYPEPEQSFGAKLALGSLSMASAFGSMVYGMSSIGYGLAGAVQQNDDYTKKAHQQQAISSFTAELTGGFDALARVRFGQSITAETYKLILTKKDKKVSFVKIGLSDGSESAVIITEDRTPTYVLDHLDNKLFLKSADSRIACYQL